MTHPWRTATVESGGETIYYEVTGAADAAETVVLTHGAGGSHAVWFQQVPVLAAAGYRVVSWDSRGFGLSTFVSGELGTAAAVADMVAITDAVGVERAHVVGQSMGGWWVTAFALAHPDRVETLALSNTVGGLWTDALVQHFASFVASETRAAEAATSILGEGTETQLGLHSALAPGFGARDPVHAFLYQELNTFHSPPLGAVGRALAGASVEHAALDAIGVPLLMITSTDDALFPAALVIESANLLADATIVEIPDAGHSAYFERPAEYNAALLDFLGARA